MKWIWCFVVAGAIVSCNIKNEEAVEPAIQINVNSNDSISKDTVVVAEETAPENSRLAKNTKLLLIARGSEPGWYAEFFADHLRLLIDNGTDSLVLQKDFSGADNDLFKITIPENNLAVSINDKPCTEEGSGEKRERSIAITYNKKTYKGCATIK
ncbi:MAG: hypothetical protein ABIP51_16600 [Bacteroidia bacterium]